MGGQRDKRDFAGRDAPAVLEIMYDVRRGEGAMHDSYGLGDLLLSLLSHDV